MRTLFMMADESPMPPTAWTEADTKQALRIWADYQHQHDVSSQIGRTAGIEPATGRVWFGESAVDIWRQRQAEGADTPIYCVRVGSDCYVRKGIFYRIMTAPPGYPPHQRYMIAAYKALEFDSCVDHVNNVDGSRFFANLDEARKAMPIDAKQLPFQPRHQFLELWESYQPGD